MNTILALVWACLSCVYAFEGNHQYFFDFMVLSLLAEIAWKVTKDAD